MKQLLFVLLLAGVAMQNVTAEEKRVLFSFDAAANGGWMAVNDTVMGGRSDGGLEIRDGQLRFEGILSLENNGGFSSIRNDVYLDLSDNTGIRLRVKGDGRSYQLRFQTDSRYFGRPVAYSGRFDTKAGEWVEVDVPFARLEAGFRGRDLDGYQFDPSQIQMLGILLGDKQPGPFRLDIAWIAAY